MFYTSSYNKGWMSFIKHSNADPVFHSKPLDSVKNWNDHFFWVDSTAFYLSVSLKSKILSKDPLPKLSHYNTEACDFLQMDLFAFIRHSNPTKVRIGEREHAKREVKLLTLAERGDDRQEHSIERDDDVLEETVAKDISEVGVEKTKKKRKRKAMRDASGSTLPPKKLREDYHAATSNISGKSLATIRGLIPKASVTPIPDDGNGGPTDSVSGLNLRTRPPTMRYVVSSTNSHHSGSRAEVNSFTRSPIADVPMMTVAVTTTIAADVSVVPVSRGGVKSGNLKNVGCEDRLSLRLFRPHLG
ncbi:hypothetical protein Tco_1198804 [Tanacetum coccineum]